MKQQLIDLNRWVIEREAEEKLIISQRDNLISKVNQITKLIKKIEQARDIVNIVLQNTQQQIKSFIEEVVTLALSAVYGDEYAFELEYIVKRNQSEANLWIVRNGIRFSPKEEVGGGINDVTSFALRLANWALMSPRPAGVFILDEPTKFLSVDLQPRFGELLKEVKNLLDVQIIISTHSEQLVIEGDKKYGVKLDKEESIVTEIGE